MKAIVLTEHGGAEKLNVGDTAKPEPGDNEVLVRVHAAAVNHLDIWVRTGNPAYPVDLPHIPGADGSGVVASAGPGAEGVGEGERVLIIPSLTCGRCRFCRSGRDNQCVKFEILGARRPGTYGAYVAVPDENVVPIPESMSFEEAAAFPLAYLTAWHMVVGRANVQAGDSVLVVGAGSGVATGAIQIAKHKGATVYAVTTHGEKAEKIKALGVADVLAMESGGDFSEWAKERTDGRGMDVVVEHVGPARWAASVKSLARYGRLATCGATSGPTVSLDLRHLFSRDLSILGARMGSRKEFQELAPLVFSGKIKPVIDSVFPLEQAAESHQRMENGRHIGKIILTISNGD